MGKQSQLPPLLLARAIGLWLSGRISFHKEEKGKEINGDEIFDVFRKVTVDLPGGQDRKPGAIFRVSFQFARFSLRANKILSLIPIPFIIAQHGFRSKTWAAGRKTEAFLGYYEWETIEDAERYWNSFPMKMMKKRSRLETLEYEIKESGT